MTIDVQVLQTQLQSLIAQLLAASSLDTILPQWGQQVCDTLGVDRLTLYTVTDNGTVLTSRAKLGLQMAQPLKLPVGPQSIAGFVAHTRQPLNLADVYDAQTLSAINPNLHFLDALDKRTGYRTKQMIVVPIFEGNTPNGQLLGVIQLLNNKAAPNEPFSDPIGAAVLYLAQTLSRIWQSSNPTSAQPLPTTPTAPVQPPLSSAPLPPVTKKYDSLLGMGLITAQDLFPILTKASTEGLSPEKLLMEECKIPLKAIGEALGKFFRSPYEPMRAGFVKDDKLHAKLSYKFCKSEGWIPFEEKGKSIITICLDPEFVRSKRVVTHMYSDRSTIKYVVTTEFEFEKMLISVFGEQDASVDSNLDVNALMANLTKPLEASDDINAEMQSAMNADNEVVRFVNKIIVEAFLKKASDIHIEPMLGKTDTQVRLRIDGGLIAYTSVPATLRQSIAARIKIMADLDISETRRPQDGKITFRKFGPLDIELRVATLPSTGGLEDVVMRILAGGEPIPMDQLGLSKTNRSRLENTVSKPYGLFYVCGPTGSGKTTTLHSILKFLNTSDTKIWTAEDPVEITQKGLRQVQINKKAGIDFALIMRAFLRADPDIIMVGESRDLETVSMGIEASLTGHMVFSTLHTNSAPESITRLLDMGMDPFNFADALLGILAQRLAKRLCTSCKEAYTPDQEELNSFIQEYAQELQHTPAWKMDFEGEAHKLQEQWIQEYGKNGKLMFHHSKGCDKCNNTGYKGRLGLHELLVADDALKKLIQERARVAQMFACAVESGMTTLKMDGMQKVLAGHTDIKQVRMVCIK